MFLISQMFFIQFWRLPAHFWMIQVIFRLSFSLNFRSLSSSSILLCFLLLPNMVPCNHVTYRNSIPILIHGNPSLSSNEGASVVTPLWLHNNQYFFLINDLKVASYTTYKTFSNNKSLTIPLSLMYKIHQEPSPHTQITPECHTLVCKYKGNIILMNSEFTQLLNHRIQDLGWTFS